GCKAGIGGSERALRSASSVERNQQIGIMLHAAQTFLFQLHLDVVSDKSCQQGGGGRGGAFYPGKSFLLRKIGIFVVSCFHLLSLNCGASQEDDQEAER